MLARLFLQCGLLEQAVECVYVCVCVFEMDKDAVRQHTQETEEETGSEIHS